MAVVVQIGTVEHIFAQGMLLRISDKATEISHKNIVVSMSIYRDHVAKTLSLNFPKTQERHMLARVLRFPFAIVEKRFLIGRRCRVVLSVVPPIEQICNRPMLVILFKVDLCIAIESFVCV